MAADHTRCIRCTYPLPAGSRDGVCPTCLRADRPAPTTTETPEWTPQIGLRRALVTLGIGMAVSAAWFFVMAWIAKTPLAWIIDNLAGRGRIVLWAAFGLTIGIPAAWLCWSRVVDRAGMTGPVLGVIAVFGAAVAFAIGGYLAMLIAETPHEIAFQVGVAATFIVAMWVTRSVIAD